MKISAITNIPTPKSQKSNPIRKMTRYVSKKVTDLKDLSEDLRIYLPRRSKYVQFGDKMVREVDLPNFAK